MGTTGTMLDGILASLIAGAIWAVIALLIAACVRYTRARPFMGRYSMFESNGNPTQGTVTVEYRWWRNVIVLTPVLSVFAEHGSGDRLGTEDWRGLVEVLSVSDVASGFFWYPCRQGGALRLVLSGDRSEIREYGTPHRLEEKAFIIVLKRIGRVQKDPTQN
jgi:hypothetical protein